MLITLIPTTPKGPNDKKTLDPLIGVSDEKRVVIEKISPHLSIMPIVRITPDANVILADLENCQIAHFACYGISHPTDPSSSGLVLQRLAPDGRLEQDYLTIYRISQSQLKHAKIAYLSAYSTAENKDARLRDEVIHIVSGF
jgi:CHAT domain-containing protein